MMQDEDFDDFVKAAQSFINTMSWSDIPSQNAQRAFSLSQRHVLGSVAQWLRDISLTCRVVDSNPIPCVFFSTNFRLT